MKRIYTCGHSLEDGNLTVADKIANKAAGIKMTQVTAQNAEKKDLRQRLTDWNDRNDAVK